MFIFNGKNQFYLDNIKGSTFGIVKHEKRTPYFGGRVVRGNYQLLNTLQLSYDEMEDVLIPSIKYIEDLHSDPVVFRYHVGYGNIFDETVEGEELYKNKYDIIYDMLGANNKFCKTQLYYDFRQEVIDKLRDDLRNGHVLLKTYCMMKNYENEQTSLETDICKYEEVLAKTRQTESNVGSWLAIIGKYTDITELNAEILNEFIEKILIHKPEKDENGNRTQKIDICYRFIGKID